MDISQEEKKEYLLRFEALKKLGIQTSEPSIEDGLDEMKEKYKKSLSTQKDQKFIDPSFCSSIIEMFTIFVDPIFFDHFDVRNMLKNQLMSTNLLDDENIFDKEKVDPNILEERLALFFIFIMSFKKLLKEPPEKY